MPHALSSITTITVVDDAGQTHTVSAAGWRYTMKDGTLILQASRRRRSIADDLDVVRRVADAQKVRDTKPKGLIRH